MRDHVKIIGILHVVLGGLSVLTGLGVFALFAGIAGVTATAAGPEEHGLLAGGIMAGIGTAIAGFMIVLGIPSMVGGFGLMKMRPWARMLIMIVAVFELFHFPIGTGVGVYSLMMLSKEETKELFETDGVRGGARRFA